MKVLHVEGGRHYYGGARQVAYLVEGLERRGIRNVLACPPGAEVARHVAGNARVIDVALRGDVDALFAWRLARLLRAERPDLVHLHSRRGVDTWGALASHATQLPCVLSRRVDNPEPRWLVAAKYRLVDHVIAISEGIRRVLIDEGLPAQRVTCVRSAIDASPWRHAVDPAALRGEFGLPGDAIVVGMVAQLIARKGHRYLLQAAASLRDAFPTLRVLLFGQGPLRAQLEAEVARRGLREVVRFAGFREDLARWLGGLDVLAHPADIEGLGVALLQAQAAGVPVIASRAGGMPEAVADGVSGRLVAPGDVAALTEALGSLLADPDTRRRMGEAGRARILSEFSVDAMVEGNLRVYRQVLAARGSHAAAGETQA